MSVVRMLAAELENRVPIILLIENEVNDVFLFRRSLARANFRGVVRVVGSVSEARVYLEGTPPFEDRRYFPFPDLIVSDMSLPGASGNAFLAWLRASKRFDDVPFVFLSGSFRPLERERAKQLGVDEFFAKTGDIDVMTQRVQQILALLPRELPPAG